MTSGGKACPCVLSPAAMASIGAPCARRSRRRCPAAGVGTPGGPGDGRLEAAHPVVAHRGPHGLAQAAPHRAADLEGASSTSPARRPPSRRRTGSDRGDRRPERTAGPDVVASRVRCRSSPGMTRSCAWRPPNERLAHRAGSGARDRRALPGAAPADGPRRSGCPRRLAARDRLRRRAHLAEVLDAEVDERDGRRRERRIAEARFPRLKPLDDFDLAAAPAIPPARGVGPFQSVTVGPNQAIIPR
jgi:hypothetical protein